VQKHSLDTFIDKAAFNLSRWARRGCLGLSRLRKECPSLLSIRRAAPISGSRTSHSTCLISAVVSAGRCNTI
jgi:hypothetical protein